MKCYNYYNTYIPRLPSLYFIKPFLRINILSTYKNVNNSETTHENFQENHLLHNFQLKKWVFI